MVSEQTGTQVCRETSQVPHVFTIDAQVGVVVKIVDVETGELVWVGSTSNEGVNADLALELAAKSLVKEFRKQSEKMARRGN